MDVLERLKYECENGHRDLLLALADEAEERGENKLARGYRWLCHNRKWPQEIVFSAKRTTWAWSVTNAPDGLDRISGASLPFHPKMKRPGGREWGDFMMMSHSCHEALEAAALVFWTRWKKGRRPTDRK